MKSCPRSAEVEESGNDPGGKVEDDGGGGAAVGILLSLEIVLEVSVLALISLYDKHLFCLK